jgi:hypothetical protein
MTDNELNAYFEAKRNAIISENPLIYSETNIKRLRR